MEEGIKGKNKNGAVCGAYRLRNPKTGKDVENPWNAAQLRRFYP
jgi:hypothetical protein